MLLQEVILGDLKSKKECRRQSHKSKNADVVKQEKAEIRAAVNAAAAAGKKSHSAKGCESKSQLSLLKEILHDDEQIKNLILKSDSTLKVVQSFFSDDDKPQETKVTIALRSSAESNGFNQSLYLPKLLFFFSYSESGLN